MSARSSLSRPHRSATSALLIGAVVISVGLSACISSAPTASATPTPWPTPIISEKPTYKVRRGTVSDHFNLQGQVAPLNYKELSFTVDGRLSVLNVAPGVNVNSGDVLAQLEMAGLDDQLEQATVSLEQAQDQLKAATDSQRFAVLRAQLSLKSAQLTLQKLRDAQQFGRPLQLQQAKAELERSRVSLERAQVAYNAVSGRPDIGMTSQAAALQTATLDYQVAEARFQQQLVDDGSNGIALQEVTVQQAQLVLDEQQSKTDPALARTVTKNQLQVDTLQKQVEARILRAPFAGGIVAVGVKATLTGGTLARPLVGDKVTAFVSMIVVAKPAPQEVLVRSDQKRATELVVGQALRITHRAFPGGALEGKVTAMPITSLGSGAQPAIQVLRIGLPANTPGLSSGDYVDVEVVKAVHENTLYLPPGAIRTFSGRAFVVIQDGDKQRRVDVPIGLQNQDQVEILSGVAEGDLVVGQ